MGVSTRAVLVDMEPGPVADAVHAALGPRATNRSARTVPDAVDVVASLDPAVLVIGPAGGVDAGSDESGDDATVHRAVVERTRWWCEAAMVTGAFVVLVGSATVFGDNPAPPPDEFTPPTPAGMPGRAWRAAEVIVGTAGGAVVRSGDADPATVADVVTWVAAGRRPGTWHVGGPHLDDLHTRVVRGMVGGAASGAGAS